MIGAAWLQRWWAGRSRDATSATVHETSPARTRGLRWVVVDVESSGLDAHRDRLLAIAAVAVHFDVQTHRPRIELADSFEVFLQQSPENTQHVDKANILIHRIGLGAQRAGVPPVQALKDWIDYLGSSPLVAYHSAFDQTMIDRALREHLPGLRSATSSQWLDLEPLAAVVHADPRSRALDHWLDLHRISCLARHHAAADALATAELLLALWPLVRQRLQTHRRPDFAQVMDLADAYRFMPGRHGSR